MDALLNHLQHQLEQLLPDNAQLILACSGGPDSQALLDLVGRLLATGSPYRALAVGVDHGLRPEASKELSLAKDLAESHGIDFQNLEVTLSKSGNLLENARIERYKSIQEFGAQFQDYYILTAHSATDQCETLVQRLSRGTGLRGAAAIRAKRDRLVRPLLGMTRTQLLEYVKSRNIPYACDPGNLNRARTRTLIRQDIVPVLKSCNSQALKHWANFAAHSAKATDFLDSLANPLLQKAAGHLGSICVSVMSAEPEYLRQWAFGLWLESHGLPLDSHCIEELEALLRRPGKAMSIAGKTILNESGHLWPPSLPSFEEQKLSIGQEFNLGLLGGRLSSRVEDQKKSQISRLKSPTQVAFDADRLHLGLKVRAWKAGDRFNPFGLQGSVKIGDFFTNLKIPTPMREHWPLVISGEAIIWVVGLRRSALAPMSNDTANVIYMEYTGPLEA